MTTQEIELDKLERELEAMGWVRIECGYFEDPFTGSHLPMSVAVKIAIQRRDKLRQKRNKKQLSSPAHRVTVRSQAAALSYGRHNAGEDLNL